MSCVEGVRAPPPVFRIAARSVGTVVELHRDRRASQDPGGYTVTRQALSMYASRRTDLVGPVGELPGQCSCGC